MCLMQQASCALDKGSDRFVIRTEVRGQPLALPGIFLKGKDARLFYDEACGFGDLPRDLVQVIAAKRDAAFCWISGSAPLMDENCRTFVGCCNGPIPIGDDHKIIERIGASEGFVAMVVRVLYVSVVLRIGWRI